LLGVKKQVCVADKPYKNISNKNPLQQNLDYCQGFRTNMKKIIALVFPEHGTNKDGMLLYSNIEPGILHVIPPDTENIQSIYVHDHAELDQINDSDVVYYLCSVYITGVQKFFDFANKIDKTKIILGGAQPTMTPELFTNTYHKLVLGLCNNFYETLKKPGNIVTGVVDHSYLPRYDLYDTKWNCQIIPDRFAQDSCSSINTSIGCVHSCEFCCTPVMYGRTIYSKPLDFLREEAKILSNHGKTQFKNVFIRDENLFMLEDWDTRLEILKQESLAEKFHCFASADKIQNKAKQILKKGINLVNLDFGMPKRRERKNKRFYETCQECFDEGLQTQISFIIDPTEVVDPKKETEMYALLWEMTEKCRPVMLSGNFLMPFPGTRIAKKFNIGIDDYHKFILKSAKLLINDENVVKRLEQNMFDFQLNYFESSSYQQLRKFRCGDVLDLKYQQLAQIFSNPKLKANFNGIGFNDD